MVSLKSSTVFSICSSFTLDTEYSCKRSKKIRDGGVRYKLEASKVSATFNGILYADLPMYYKFMMKCDTKTIIA